VTIKVFYFFIYSWPKMKYNQAYNFYLNEIIIFTKNNTVLLHNNNNIISD